MTTDSPINYPCPTCLRPRGEACIRPIEAQDLVYFHLSRRAARMSALAARSTPPDRGYTPTEFEPRNVAVVRQTRIKRPDPQLPLEYRISDSQLAIWERAVKATVDAIFAQEGTDG